MAIKKHWVSIVMAALLLVIAILLGTLYTSSAAEATKIIGTYCASPSEDVPPVHVDFQNHTYSFFLDNTYHKYGQFSLLEEGRISFVRNHIFRLTPTQGKEHEIILMDDVIYEHGVDGLYKRYFFMLKPPAIYGGNGM